MGLCEVVPERLLLETAAQAVVNSFNLTGNLPGI